MLSNRVSYGSSSLTGWQLAATNPKAVLSAWEQFPRLFTVLPLEFVYGAPVLDFGQIGQT